MAPLQPVAEPLHAATSRGALPQEHDSTSPMSSSQQNGASPPRSREIEVLLCCARTRLDADRSQQLRALLQGEINWEALVRLSHRHGLLPLFYRHLTHHAADLLPVSVQEQLRGGFLRNMRHSLVLTQELREILRLLEEHAVPAIAMKGPVLAHYVYGDVSLRMMRDLDLLVRNEDVTRARELLATRGYGLLAPLTRLQEKQLRRVDSNFVLVQQGSGVVLELHWTPEPHLPGGAEQQIWDRSACYFLAGTDMRTLVGEDLLVLLCMHGARHMWERLEWVTGVATLLNRGDIHWTRLSEVASFMGGRRALRVGLALAHDLLQAELPPEIIAQLRADPAVNRLHVEAREHLFRDSEVLAHHLGLPFHLFQLRTRERLRDRVHYLYDRTLGASLEDGTPQRIPLPDRLFPLYALLYPVGLIAAYGARLFRERR
jgi:hypothetical protein